MKNFCRYCGKPLMPEAVFCRYCGRKIDDAEFFEEENRSYSGSTVHNKTQEFIENRKRNAGASRNEPRERRAGASRNRPSAHDPYPYADRSSQKTAPGTNPQYDSKASAGRSSGGKRAVAAILIIVLIGGVLFAGFKYPGFFLQKDGPGWEIAEKPSGGNEIKETGTPSGGNETGGTGTQTNSAFTEDNYIPAVVSEDDIPVMHPFSEANITFSDEERNSSPVFEAAVSAANPVVSCGDITVDFKGWNLDNDEDTLVIRELPVKTDDEAGYTIAAYDFSLSSGQHEFLTDITVRIPRDPDADEGGWCVTYNEETQQWETLYSEVSEDGLYYEINTSHFSLEGKARFSSKDVQEIAKNKQNNLSDDKTKDYLSTFYYPYPVTAWALKDAQVTINFDYFWNRVDSKYTLTADEMKAWIDRTPQDDMAWKSPISAEAMLGNSDGGFASFALFGGEKVIKAGTKAAGQYAAQQLIEGNDNGFLAAKMAGRLGGLVRHTGRAVGYVNALYNLYATPAKIYHETQQGKTTWEATMNHKLDVIGTTAGALSLAASAGLIALSGPVAAGVAVVGTGAWIASVIYSSYAPRDLGPVEQLYRDYYTLDPSNPMVVFYDTALPTAAMGANIGSMEALPSLKDDEEANSQFRELLKDGLLAFDPRESGSSGLFTEPTTTNQRLKLQKWVLALKFLFKYAENEPEKLMNLISEFYTNYAMVAWNIGEENFTEFAKGVMVRWRGWDTSKYSWPEEKVRKQYTDNYVTELMTAHKDILEAIVKQYDDEAKKVTEDFIRNEELPYLNTRMEFRVNGIENTPFAVDWQFIESNMELMDSTTPDDPNFNYSDLILPMRFANKIEGQYYEIQGPAFLPYYEKANGEIVPTNIYDFWPEQTGFIPRYKEGDLVFTCTYYYYLMMGAPDTMLFTNSEGFGYSVPVSFDVPDTDGVIKINIDPPSNDLAELEGDWVRSYNGTEYENKELNDVRLGVHDGGKFNSFYSNIEAQDELDIIQRHDDDPKFYYNKDSWVLTIWQKDTDLRYDYTVNCKRPNVIYLEEIDYYLEREDISAGSLSLHLEKVPSAGASLKINNDGTLTVDIPEYNDSGLNVSGIHLKAEKTEEPDERYGYDEAVGKHYVVTECPASIIETWVTTNSEGEQKTETKGYTGFVIGKENLPMASCVKLFYDTKDPDKLLFVQVYLHYGKSIRNGNEKDIGYIAEYFKKLVF